MKLAEKLTERKPRRREGGVNVMSLWPHPTRVKSVDIKKREKRGKVNWQFGSVLLMMMMVLLIDA